MLPKNGQNQLRSDRRRNRAMLFGHIGQGKHQNSQEDQVAAPRIDQGTTTPRCRRRQISHNGKLLFFIQKNYFSKIFFWRFFNQLFIFGTELRFL